jgi:Protein of unknown function (DUF2752)
LRILEKARHESRRRLKKNEFAFRRDCRYPEVIHLPGNILKTLERKEEANPFKKDASRPPLRLDERKSRAIASAIIVAMLVAAAILPLAPPSGFPGLPACVFKNATGLPCPLCGGTRATQALLRGDLSRALYLNVAALPAAIAFVAAAWILALEAWHGRRLGDWNAPLRRLRSMLPIMVALLCIYWLVHLMDALRGPKSELVDLHNPIARAIHKGFSVQTR